MQVETIQDHLVPNGTPSEVTLFKSAQTDTICFKNSRGVVLPVGSGGGNVFKGLVATGTNANNTKTVLNYGINVFTTITNTNYSAKLPIAITGQTVIVVNNTASALKLYPSMEGGAINNIQNNPVIIPPDGISYSFHCIQNPLPGAWTWNPPATAQFDSGNISISISSGTGFGGFNPFISAYDNVVKNVLSGITSFNAGYNGKNKGLIQGSPSSPDTIYFKPATSWGSVTKIKVYTNATAASYMNLIANGEIDFYDTATGDIINNGPSVGGALAWNVNIANVIPGTPVGGIIQPFVGAPGTCWGEYVLPSSILSTANNTPFTSSVIGDQDFGDQLFTGTFPPEYVGQLVNNFYSCYLSFQMQPMYAVAYGANQTFQFRFIIEHT
jgi:hypothetical protein